MVAGNPDSDHPDIEALRITREESRAVLNHQLELLNNIDDKALRTARTSVILLGILASAAGIAGPSGISSFSDSVIALYSIGVFGLFITTVVGTGVYTVSDLTFGVGSSHREEVRNENYAEREWLKVLLDEYESWTASMHDVNSNNAFYLFITQLLLASSLGVIFSATILLTFNQYV